MGTSSEEEMVRQLLERGARVLTSDGAEIGTVRHATGSFFCVEAPQAGLYWLPTLMISSLATGTVRMGFARNELGEHATLMNL